MSGGKVTRKLLPLVVTIALPSPIVRQSAAPGKCDFSLRCFEVPFEGGRIAVEDQFDVAGQHFEGKFC